MEPHNLGQIDTSPANLPEINELLSRWNPTDILAELLTHAQRPIVTTNFRPYESAILHLATDVKRDIPVVWCDTGYNTEATYQHAHEIIQRLKLNLHVFVPRQTRGYRDVTLGIPEVDSENHALFSKQVKLEPFARAMAAHDPDLWITNLRKGQTAHRDGLGILSYTQTGILKVAPFYHYTDGQLDQYLNDHLLPNEHNYYDPTKGPEHRECGIHN